ncbi:MAG: 50S ribosomal protein L25 [Chloroflexota bacterium]
MDQIELTVTRREVLGKKVRFLRRQGITPVHLFGHNIESLALQCDTAQLERLIAQAGTTRPVSLEVAKDRHPHQAIIREVRRDLLSGGLIHVDFYQIKMTEAITADIPLVLVGEAPAMKIKGRTLLQPITHLGVRCLPDKLPPRIEIDLSQLGELEQAVHVRDIVLDPAVTVTTDPEQLVVKVTEAAVSRAEAAAEVAEAAVAETEAAVAAEPETEP